VIGQVVDGHEIVRSLGTGGMGEVYLARSAAGALRAFKIVRTDRDTGPQATARFRREVMALGKLQHAGIVQIFDAGRLAGGALYLGMEYVAGPDLQAAVDKQGPFSVADALRLLVQVAAALAFAHREGIVHRDLKPANILLANGDAGDAKIIDFGLAKIAVDEGLTRLTEDSQVLGSPLYWAPEQSATAAVGPPADVYALGGLAYFALTGIPLFRPRTAVAMVYAHLHEVPESLRARCPDLELPPGLEELVQACIAKDPARRPSAEELVIELERLLATGPSTARVKRPPRLFTATGISDLEDAVTSQIRQIVLELAAVLERPTDDIDRIQNELSELELDLAMLDSEVDAAIDPTALHHHDRVAARVTELSRALADAFRTLLDDVLAHRSNVGDAAALFTELDGLFERYRTL
jgi:serine/threonine protein kinase